MASKATADGSNSIGSFAELNKVDVVNSLTLAK